MGFSIRRAAFDQQPARLTHPGSALILSCSRSTHERPDPATGPAAAAGAAFRAENGRKTRGRKEIMPEITSARVLDALREVMDPDLHRDLVTLGMIDDV